MWPVIDAAVRSALSDVVGESRVHTDAATRRALSSDYSWLSPILRRELDGMLADVIVTPQRPVEAAAVLAIAYRGGIPLTPRGKGTGNYGQAVPLAGGIVLDVSGCAEVLDVGDGWITAEAGATFAQLEAVARRRGQELAMFPSTVHSCLGGFIGGGAGGTGSIENGFIWDGFVRALEVVPCVDHAEPAWIEGAGAVAPFLHTYGTTGLITAASVKLVPARMWTALFASFDTWAGGLTAAGELIRRDPLPRNVAVDEPALVALLPTDEAMPRGRVSLRAIVERHDAAGAARVIEDAGGRVEAVRHDAVDQLVSLSFNHITLRAVRARPELCHLQVGGPAMAARADELRACLPGALLHVDCHRHQGQGWFGGLLLSPFRDAETLAAGIAGLEAIGAQVVNPHTYLLGGHGGLEALRARAQVWDPKGLLNPGKLPAAPVK